MEETIDISQLTAADFATDFVAGLIGGSAGLITGHPFDTVKVLLQTSKTKLKLTTCVPMILKQEGPQGFFKGMSYPLASVGFLNSIFFGFNMIAASKIVGSSSNPYRDVFLAGVIAGGVQAIPATPIELVKVRLQTQLDSTRAGGRIDPSQRYSGPWDCLRKTYRSYGVRGCFRGVSPTVLRDISGFSVYIAVYRYLCDLGTGEGRATPSLTVMLVAGGMAGVVSWIANFPIDTVKSLMQADDLARPQYRGVTHCAVMVVRREGLAVLWKGFVPALARAFPLNAVTLCLYDVTQRRMKLSLRQQVPE